MVSIKNNKGQAFPYFFMMTIVLVICWMMLINLGKLVKDRMMMQNAADNAALSVACYRARVLNKIGQLNFLIACALYGTEYGVSNWHVFGAWAGPFGTPHPAIYVPECLIDNQKKIAAVGDLLLASKPTPCPGTGGGSGESSQIISGIRNLVKGMVTAQDSLRLPYPGLATIYANKIAKRQEINANGDECGADNVIILKAWWLSIPPIPIVLPQGLHLHFYQPKNYADEKKSWMYADKDEFNKNNKIVVIATKNSGSSSNKGYPFGAWFFNLTDWPSIRTIAAAGVYNASGPMFVFKEEDKISPVIKAYRKAEKGGWDAHLVPVGGYGVRH